MIQESGAPGYGKKKVNVAVIGNYIPRQCGLATFTTDLATWLSRALEPGSEVFVVAMNDRPEGYDYPPMVRFEVLANKPRDYHRAADFINLSGVDLVCLQHEFGIYGGSQGIFITELLRDLNRPVVTTMHTVLPEPKQERREALVQVASLSDAIVVMSNKSIEFLDEYYGVGPEKVYLIHHGAPDAPLTDPDTHKERWGLEARTVILTFGLLCERKGIEYMIRAMPGIVERFPEAVYVVLGATHPPLKRHEGEKHRFYLKRLARELGVEGNVVFYDRFVTLEELVDFLACCDVYVTPYLDRGQIVSGTLAYAMALGKPIVSTSYYYAEELLGDGRGILTDFRDPEGMAEGVISLLGDPGRLEAVKEEAYRFGRRLVWDEVAKEYVELFGRVLAGRAPRKAAVVPPIRTVSIRDLPTPKLDYLSRLADRTGVISGAKYDVPVMSSGYSSGDNALALAAAVLCHLQTEDPQAIELSRTCLGFLKYMQLPDGRFHEHLTYDRVYKDDVGSQECQGKVLNGLGLAVALEPEAGLASFAKSMFDEAVVAAELSYPRAVSYAICGCYHYLTRFKNASNVANCLDRMAGGLLEAYSENSDGEWRWFEDKMYYSNGLMPRALLLAYRRTGDDGYRRAGLESLEFLTSVSYTDGVFDLVGDQGWYPKGGEKARFRQLPVEAASLAGAYIDALLIERDHRYIELARAAFEWFLGRNVRDVSLYDFAAGSCADGIAPHGADPDRGAESTINFLLTLLRIAGTLHLGTEELLTVV